MWFNDLASPRIFFRSAFCYLIAISGLFVSAAAAASSGAFGADMAFKVLYVDEQEIGSFHSQGKAFPLNAGNHQILLRYSKDFGRPTSPDVISSEPIVILFSSQPGQSISIKATLPNNKSEARTYVKTPTLQLIDENGLSIPMQWFVLPPRDGIQLGRDLLAETEAYKKQHQIHFHPEPTEPALKQPEPVEVAPTKALTPPTPAAKVIPESPTAPPLATAATSTAIHPVSSAPPVKPPAAVEKNRQLDALQQLYRQADAETRKRFQIWIINQQ